MAFSDKLLKLRKEKGLSQEALAEKLNTTRQAVSKWENGQGYPETEKLLMIGNIFEVSMDYLLKDMAQQSNEGNEDQNGYYVSQEMAEGYLLNVRKTAKYISLGFSLLIFTTVPYFVFKQDPAIYTILIIIMAALGIGTIVAAIFIEEDRYKALTKEALMFDHNYLKELKARYKNVRKKYMVVIVAGICSIVVGGVSFLLVKKEIVASEVLMPYYPICVVFIAAGVYLLFRTVSILEAYRLLVKNEEYINRLGFKLMKRVRKKVDEI